MTIENEFAKLCLNGNLNEAKEYYKNNPNIDISADNESAFGYACGSGYLDIAEWLLEIKPDINISARNDYAFRHACSNGYINVAKWLLEIKPSIDISVNDDGALFYSFMHGQFEVVKWLSEINPNYKLIIEDGKITNYYIVKQDEETFRLSCSSGHLDIAKWLFETIPSIDISLNYDEIFYSSCANDRLEVAKWLLEIKPDIDISLNYDEIFDASCSNGYLEVPKWLLSIKPDISVNYNKLFIESCENGKLELAKWLLEIKPDIDMSAMRDYNFNIGCKDEVRKSEVFELVKWLDEVKGIKCNINFSCSRGCFTQWVCSWCKNTYCDDVCRPYALEGKPRQWTPKEANQEWWNSLTKKEKRKMEIKNTLEPIMTDFFLCKDCKNKYIENNICKGRHINKIGQNKNDWF